ncbi:MAG: hypothetical protein AAGF46_06365, partial [Pseudomonadota bacterium]
MNYHFFRLLGSTVLAGAVLSGCASQGAVDPESPTAGQAAAAALTVVALEVVSEVLLGATCEPDVEEGRSCDPAAEIQKDQEARQRRDRVRSAEARERQAKLAEDFAAFMNRDQDKLV